MKVIGIIIGVAIFAIAASVVFHFDKSATSIIPQSISHAGINWQYSTH